MPSRAASASIPGSGSRPTTASKSGARRRVMVPGPHPTSSSRRRRETDPIATAATLRIQPRTDDRAAPATCDLALTDRCAAESILLLRRAEWLFRIQNDDSFFSRGNGDVGLAVSVEVPIRPPERGSCLAVSSQWLPQLLTGAAEAIQTAIASCPIRARSRQSSSPVRDDPDARGGAHQGANGADPDRLRPSSAAPLKHEPGHRERHAGRHLT
jgi:hypothetical protein